MKRSSSWAEKLHIASLPTPADRDITPLANQWHECAKTLQTASLSCLRQQKASHYLATSDLLRRLSYDASLHTAVLEGHRTAVQHWRQAQRRHKDHAEPNVAAANRLREQLILLETYGLQSLQNQEEDVVLQMVEGYNRHVMPQDESPPKQEQATSDMPPTTEDVAVAQSLSDDSNKMDFSSNLRRHFTNQFGGGDTNNTAVTDPAKLGNALLQRFSSGFQMTNSFDEDDIVVPNGATELHNTVQTEANACLAQAKAITEMLDTAAVALTHLSKSVQNAMVRVSLVPAMNQAIERLVNEEASSALELAVQLARLQQTIDVVPLEHALTRDEATWRQLRVASRTTRDRSRDRSRERTASLDSAKRSIASLMLDDSRKQEAELVLDSPVASKVTELSFEAYQESADAVLKLCRVFDFDALRGEIDTIVNESNVSCEPISLSPKEISDALDAWAEEQHSKIDPTWPGEPLVEDLERLSASNGSISMSEGSMGVPGNGNPPKWLTPLMNGSDTILRKMMKKPSAQQMAKDISPETSLLVHYFLPEVVDETNVRIVQSSACSFREKSSPWPTQYGRLYCTNSKLLYCSWSRRNLNVSWVGIEVLEPVHNDMNGSDEDSLLLKFKRDGPDDEAAFVFSGIHDRTKVLAVVEELKEKAKQQAEQEAKEKAEARAREQKKEEALPEASPIALAPVDGPDPILESMQPVLSKRMNGMTIAKLYETVWSEEKPFYMPWLEENNCFDVEMGSWVDENNITGPYCKENYTRFREIRFKFKRTSHLYIGPPIANVKQTHYCRIEGDEKCVVQMTVEFDGVPYADCFRVEIRWVARLVEPEQIHVQVGVEVDFQKQTFLKSKIRSATIDETIPLHQSLYDAVKAACGQEGNDDEEEKADTTFGLQNQQRVLGVLFQRPIQDATPIVAGSVIFILLLSWIFRSRTLHSNENDVAVKIAILETEIAAMRKTLMEIHTLLQNQQSCNNDSL